jgi:hypothetical protein
MPRIAEIKIINNELWVRLEKPSSLAQTIYIWTEEEMKAHDASVIAAYIWEQQNGPQPNPPPSTSPEPRKVPSD